MKDREKELKHLIYIKSQLIKQTKKEIKAHQEEINTINGYKRLEKKKGDKYGKGNNKRTY